MNSTLGCTALSAAAKDPQQKQHQVRDAAMYLFIYNLFMRLPEYDQRTNVMQRLFKIVSLLALLTGIGTLWFWLFEGWAIIDSVYMSVITLTTVGFEEIHPLSPQGRVFVIFYLVGGLGVFMYGIIQQGELVVRAELGELWRRRDMNEERKNLSDHFIVCGAGRMGRMVCNNLTKRNIPFVVIDHDEEVIKACDERGWLAMEGDATDDQALDEACVGRARGLAVALSSDADNLYVVLSARIVSQDLCIVSRAYDDNGVRKMRKAGANHVVSLYESGAAKMAQLLTNPLLSDFFEIVSEDNVAFDLAEISVPADSKLVGKTLSESKLGARGVMIVAIRRAAGDVVLPPEGSTVIEVGDRLFALGAATAEVAELMDN
jgi:voltage-gated potassium channel